MALIEDDREKRVIAQLIHMFKDMPMLDVPVHDFVFEYDLLKLIGVTFVVNEKIKVITRNMKDFQIVNLESKTSAEKIIEIYNVLMRNVAESVT